MVRLLQVVCHAIAAFAAATLRFLAAVAHWAPVSPKRRRVVRPSPFQTDPAICAAIEAVEKVFVRDYQWSFRRLSYARYGLDARVEILDNGRVTGRFLPLQIRPAPSTTDGDNYLHELEKRDLEYWDAHYLSVCVIVVEPEDRQMFWRWVEKESRQKIEERSVIAIPVTSVLDASARLDFEEVIPSAQEILLRSAFALDRGLMEVLGDRTAIFIWDEWGETTPIFCNLRIHLDESEQGIQIDYRIRAHSLHDVMVKLFPWASYAYAEPIKEYSGEVAVHVLEVELRPEARAYIEAEEFLEAGYPDEEEPRPPEIEDFMTAEEEAAFWRSRGVSRDPHE
jgi:hypothetical protein